VANAILQLKVAFRRELSVADYPFLKSHVMNGKPVLPVAVIMEWLAHGALHNNPGLSFHGFDELRVYNGVILDPTVAYELKVLSGKAGSGKESTVKVELRGGKNGLKLHAAARVILTKALPEPVASSLSVSDGCYNMSVAEAYRSVLFHGDDLIAIEDVYSSAEDGIVAKLTAAPKPHMWFNEPLRNDWLGDPLIMDGAFQLMILWTDQHLGERSLPNFLKNYRQYVSKFPVKGVKAVISARRKSASAANADMEFIDETGRVVATITGYECTMSPSLKPAFKKRTLD
jgi:hypothetical protein